MGCLSRSRRRSRTTPNSAHSLRALAPDCIVIVGYGRIIPRWMLDLPEHGNINLHASLLPKYRGAAPIQWAIASGETVTGNTTMRIDEGLDTGDILLQREMADLARGHQRDAGSAAGGDGRRAAGGDPCRTGRRARLQPTPQDNARATLAPILTREDGRIDFARARADDLQSLSRISAVARSVHNLSRQAAHAACDLGLFRRTRAVAAGEIAVAGERLLAGCGAGIGDCDRRVATGRQAPHERARVHQRISAQGRARRWEKLTCMDLTGIASLPAAGAAARR